MLQQLLTGSAVFLAGTSLAHATLINGTSLQDQLDARTADGSFLDVNDDQVSGDSLWTLGSINSGTAMVMFELAGFANQNVMGLYDPGNLNNTLELFSGAAGSGSRVGLRESDSTPGLFGTCVWSEFGCGATGNTISLGGSGQFGFYLDTPADGGTRFYSQAALNGDAAPDGTTDHMVTFAGDGSEWIDPLNNGDHGLFAPGEYIIAWEDLLLSGSDRDYNDMVVLMESIIPVPAPGSLALLGAGLLAFRLTRTGRAGGAHARGARSPGTVA